MWAENNSVRLNNLTLPELYYVVTHLSEFEYDLPLGRISDERLRSAIAESELQTKIERSTRVNLAYGLEALEVLSDPVALERVKRHCPSDPDNDPVFGDRWNLGRDPDKWGDECDRIIQHALDSIKKAEQAITVMRDLKQAVEAQCGSWKAFVRDYREYVAKAVREAHEKGEPSS